MRGVAWLLAAVALVVLLAAAGPGGRAAPAVSAAPVEDGPARVVLMRIDRPIGPAESDYVQRGLELAALLPARLVVLQIQAPGGLASAVDAMARDLAASPVPVAAFVGPGAAQLGGRGVALLGASHLAAMSAEAMLVLSGPTPPREQMLNASEALRQGWVAVVARDLSDLLLQLDGRELRTSGASVQLDTRRASVRVFEPDLRMHALSLATTPAVVLLLLMSGLAALLYAMVAPGAALPGVLGALAVTAALFGMQRLPTSHAAFALVLGGLALMVVVALWSRFELLGFAGIALFAAGAGRLVPTAVPGFALAWWVAAVLGLLAAFVIGTAAALARRSRRLPQAGGPPVPAGAVGELMEFADGEGWVRIRGDYWRARGASDLRPGQRVRVAHMQGAILHVVALSPSSAMAPLS